MFKKLWWRKFLLKAFPFFISYHQYEGKVAGWDGYYTLGGATLGFKSQDGRLVTSW